MSTSSTMPISVVKRSGKRELVSFDQILERVQSQSSGLNVDPVSVAQTVVQGIRDGITTSELDKFTVETAAAMAVQHPDYSIMAARVAVSDLHKKTSPSIRCVFDHMDPQVKTFAEDNIDRIDRELKFERDLGYTIFGFKTLERSYLLKNDVGDIIERPQILLMRNALGIHCGDIEKSIETYTETSLKKFTHATPTMFNAGTKNPNMASCFLLPVMDDSIDGIFETLKRCAKISKSAGGIGLSFTNVRAGGSKIVSTGGKSAGLLPFLRTYDATARAVDQGGGKRKGAFAVYLEPWHLDIFTFLDLKKPHGTDELRARDLFYALWICDLFMQRVEGGKRWTLFCPRDCPDLVDLYGEAFEKRYMEYEDDSSLRKRTILARDLWNAILDAQIETGTPYMLYKDAANRCSNQKNLGTIRSSNLCTEIMEVSTDKEVAVCNLASIALPKFIRDEQFDFQELYRITRIVTRNLNRVIDGNLYPLEEAKTSNLTHRPVGIGVQGLADCFMLLDIPFDSPEARVLNRDIFETIYYAALTESCELAKELGPYDSYLGSPASQGKLQFDLWEECGKVKVSDLLMHSRWDWTSLKQNIAKNGLRNSLLVAPMPTASTAQIMGNTECFEPVTSLVYLRRVLAGEFPVLNALLVAKLEELNLWSEEMRLDIIAANGSIQKIKAIPNDVKKVFKTAWEMSQRAIIDLAADRAVFVDQSQSLNLFMADATRSKLSSMHFYAWKKGLKTGMYYLRSKPASNAIQVTVPVKEEAPSCSRNDPDCESCSA